MNEIFFYVLVWGLYFIIHMYEYQMDIKII